MSCSSPCLGGRRRDFSRSSRWSALRRGARARDSTRPAVDLHAEPGASRDPHAYGLGSNANSRFDTRVRQAKWYPHRECSTAARCLDTLARSGNWRQRMGSAIVDVQEQERLDEARPPGLPWRTPERRRTQVWLPPFWAGSDVSTRKPCWRPSTGVYSPRSHENRWVETRGARSEPEYVHAARSLPGFMMPSGSRAAFTLRISSISISDL